MHTGRHRLMLRKLLLTGLTALSLASLASVAHAGGRGSSATRKKSESSHHGQTGAPAAESELERPAGIVAPVVKKVVKVKRAGATRIARRLQGAAVNQSLLRQSWTLADLNPMPALLDLDDTARSLRRATAEIARLMTR